MARIDERTTVPLWWVWVAGTAILAWTAIGATWVKGVNDRLTRIEDKLGIDEPVVMKESPKRSEWSDASNLSNERIQGSQYVYRSSF